MFIHLKAYIQQLVVSSVAAATYVLGELYTETRQLYIEDNSFADYLITEINDVIYFKISKILHPSTLYSL